ncbi:MAG: GIY-YIG nuclease family protein [Phormidesmis sp.]
MDDNTDALNSEALRILKVLDEMPFGECCPLTKEFAELPPSLGICAIKHKTKGILYIGKSGSVKGRFKGGHDSSRLNSRQSHLTIVTG